MSTGAMEAPKSEVDLKAQLEEMSARVKKLEDKQAKKAKQENKVSIFVFSGDLDHALVAFNIAISSANLGMEVSMFFTFWGLPLIKDPKKKGKNKTFMARMMGFMLPNGVSKYKLSQMNMLGMGTAMMKNVMKEKNITSLEERLEIVQQLGVTIYACDNSILMMGVDREDLIDYENLKVCGAAKFAADSVANGMTLFF